MIRHAYLIFIITLAVGGIIAISAHDEMQLASALRAANSTCHFPQNAFVVDMDPVRVERAGVAAAKAKIPVPPKSMMIAKVGTP